MTDEKILELIRAGLHQVVPERDADFVGISLANSIDELALDSIATMELIGFLEDETQKTFPDEDLPRVDSLADIASLMRYGKL
jgi:acyl carrier protein